MSHCHHVHLTTPRTRNRVSTSEATPRTRIRAQERFGIGPSEPRDAARKAADRQCTLQLRRLRRVHRALVFLRAHGNPPSIRLRVVHRRVVQTLDQMRYQLMLKVFGQLMMEV
jgi:hypothetical protein